MVDDFVAPEVVQERMDRLLEVVEPPRARPPPARASGESRRSSSTGRRSATPTCSPGAPARTSSCTSRPSAASRAGDLVDVDVTDAAPHWMRGRIVSDPRPGRAGRRRIPVTVE